MATEQYYGREEKDMKKRHTCARRTEKLQKREREQRLEASRACERCQRVDAAGKGS